MSVTVVDKRDGVARLTFKVRDTGVGMSADTLPKLFKPFMQADASTTRRRYRAGAVYRAASRATMGGEITAESKRERRFDVRIHATVSDRVENGARSAALASPASLEAITSGFSGSVLLVETSRSIRRSPATSSSGWAGRSLS